MTTIRSLIHVAPADLQNSEIYYNRSVKARESLQKGVVSRAIRLTRSPTCKQTRLAVLIVGVLTP